MKAMKRKTVEVGFAVDDMIGVTISRLEQDLEDSFKNYDSRNTFLYGTV